MQEDAELRFDYAEEDEAPIDLIAMALSDWQLVIHGGERVMRGQVARVIEEEKGRESAVRYALCGRGDKMHRSSKGEFRMIPCGCNERLCQRCSRKRGVKFLNKVGRHLTLGAHGEIWHVVLTQRVRGAETLRAAVDRLTRKWKPLNQWMKRTGMVAGLLTIHVKWSRHGGWHVHQHCLLEFDRGVCEEEVKERWLRIMRLEDDDDGTDPFVRRVVEAGDAFADDLVEGQGDFWKESKDEVAVALQYPLRDILQGVSDWTISGADDSRVKELYLGTKKVKMHRLLGRWRLDAEEYWKEKGVEIPVKEEKPVEDAVWVEIGTMDHCTQLARAGVRNAALGLEWLESRCHNDSILGKRIVEFCRRWQDGLSVA